MVDGVVVGATPRVFQPGAAEIVSYDRVLDFAGNDEPASWSFLADGTGVVHLTGLSCEHDPSYPEVCLCQHSATVESAELQVVLGTGVAIEPQAWSAIKGLYR